MARSAKDKPQIPEFLRRLVEAAASGRDVEPLFAMLREQFGDKPGADEFIDTLRHALAEARAKAEGAG